MKNFGFVFMICLLVLVSCKKKSPITEEISFTGPLTRGLPSTYKKVDGFLSVTKIRNGNSIQVILYSAFIEPGNNLLKTNDFFNSSFNHLVPGTVDVGIVRFNSYTKIKPQNNSQTILYYENSTFQTIPDTIRWTTDGNGSFTPIDVNISSPFAFFLNYPANKRTISKTNSFKIETDSIFANYDSLGVFIYDSYNPQYAIKKIKGKGSGPFVYSVQEIAAINIANSPTYIITFQVCNYFHQIINDRTYVFEFIYKFNFNAPLTP